MNTQDTLTQPPASAPPQEAAPDTVLVIDDESNLLRLFKYNIRSLGYEVATGGSVAEFRQLIGEREYATVLLDMMLPDGDGLELIEEVHELYPHVPVILITAYGSIDKAVQSMKLGAFDFVTKPVDIDRLNALLHKSVEHYRLRREVKSLRMQLDPPDEFRGMVGSSQAMLDIYNMIESVAPTGATVMIVGESGTGKELVANALHEISPRRERPFVAINCAAIPHDLLESELFGHEKGSFTGATGRHQGCFERAHKGTLFLDEICEMDLALQAKLLRLIQERQFYRIGGTEPITVDVRFVSATNQDPAQAVREGRFREDLFYRLNVVPIRVPPLRERREDIGQIAHKFLLEFAAENHKSLVGFDLRALAAMENYGWAGNVRELRNVVEQIVVLNDGERATLEMLPEHIRHCVADGQHSTAPEPGPDRPADLEPEDVKPLWQTEREQIQKALDLCGGNVAEAAKRIELSAATLYRKIEKYGLSK